VHDVLELRMARHRPTTRLSEELGRLYHFSWVLGVLETPQRPAGQKKAGAEAPAKKRRNLDSDAPSNLEDSPPVRRKIV
jgi:hypothetical protein